MRVLLFVQTGDGRPKCVGRGYPANDSSAPWDNYVYIYDGSGEWMVTQRADRRLRAADRWWLVECETADEGRWTLLKAGFVRGPLFPTKFREGRILASGGKG